ncbi:hypothetical protein [Agrobacterium cavarae]|uniref:hypothetical protein n=1 Tax=Agrobacterium cavarae TaxID=2528239 RepID=UPI0028B016DA|nr:hypothetical protein [Agrobacterium cavarae]
MNNKTGAQAAGFIQLSRVDYCMILKGIEPLPLIGLRFAQPQCPLASAFLQERSCCLGIRDRAVWIYNELITKQASASILACR